MTKLTFCGAAGMVTGSRHTQMFNEGLPAFGGTGMSPKQPASLMVCQLVDFENQGTANGERCCNV